MVEDFEKEREYDGQKAWSGYYIRFADKNFYYFKHAREQRSVKCLECDIRIPKEVPRVFLYGSWHHKKGHYCLTCASKVLDKEISVKQAQADDLLENLLHLNMLKATVDETRTKERYKEIMGVHILMNRLKPKEEEY